jgi:ankyrin repeat protein
MPLTEEEKIFFLSLNKRDIPYLTVQLKSNPKLIFAKDEKGYTALHRMAAKGSTEVLQVLLAYLQSIPTEERKKKDKVQFSGYTPLHSAACNGHLEAVKLLINHYDINDDDNIAAVTALHLAVRQVKIKTIEYLLSKGASVNLSHPLFPFMTPLYEAIKTHDMRVFNLLVAKGAQIKLNHSEPGVTTFLHVALKCGNDNVAEKLIKNGADIDTADEDGYTPLHLAVKRGKSYLVELLLSRRADPNGKHPDNLTPLHMAAANNNVNMINILTNKTKLPINVNPNIKSTNETPFIYAIKSNASAEVRNLLYMLTLEKNYSLKRSFTIYAGTSPTKQSYASKYQKTEYSPSER